MDKETLDKANLLAEKIDALEEHLHTMIHGSYDKEVTGVSKIVLTEYLKWPNGKDHHNIEIYPQFLPDDWLDKYRDLAKIRLEELKQELKQL